MPDCYKVFQVIAGEFSFFISEEDIQSVDFQIISPEEIFFLRDHRPAKARLLNLDRNRKKIHIELEGEEFEIEIKDELDLVMEKMGFGRDSAKRVREIKAPMPGLVLEICVSEGQEINEGERILILEAMKMENSITSLQKVRISKLLVSPGQAVEKGQVLAELD